MLCKFILFAFEKKLQVPHSLLSTCDLLPLTVYHLPITNYHLPTTNLTIGKSVISKELKREGEIRLCRQFGWMAALLQSFGLCDQSSNHRRGGGQALSPTEPRSNHRKGKGSSVTSNFVQNSKVGSHCQKAVMP